MIKAQALEPFPDRPIIDNYLKNLNRNYETFIFEMDSGWRSYSFSIAQPGREKNNLEILLDLCKIPQVFSGEYLVDTSSVKDGVLLLENTAILQAFEKYDFNVQDIEHVDGLNHRAKAFLDLGRNLGLNIYPPFAALPHQFGALRASNTRARYLYDDLNAKIAEKLSLAEDESLGADSYSRVPIQPLCQVALMKCKDSLSSLAAEICELRQKHSTFRRYLTQFEGSWATAKTKQERLQLNKEYENAWKSLVERIDKPSTRIIYQIWDFVKKPTEILGVIGDKLTAKGREQYLIDRVGGLYDFWRELANSPVSDQNQSLLRKLFPKVAEAEIWTLASEAAHKFNTAMIENPN